MRNTILSGWNFIRLFRLFIGVSALAAFYSEHDSFMGILGLIVTAQAVFNVGCCGSTGCSTKPFDDSKDNASDKIEISFEEIKIKNP